MSARSTEMVCGSLAEVAEVGSQVIEIIMRKCLRKCGEGVAKMLKSLCGTAELFTYTTYRPAAFGAGRLRISAGAR